MLARVELTRSAVAAVLARTELAWQKKLTSPTAVVGSAMLVRRE